MSCGGGRRCTARGTVTPLCGSSIFCHRQRLTDNITTMSAMKTQDIADSPCHSLNISRADDSLTHDPNTLEEKRERFIINAVFERICKLLNCH